MMASVRFLGRFLNAWRPASRRSQGGASAYALVMSTRMVL